MHLDIVKHVPVAGGMGGGSADAAAALVACDALWGADLGTAQLHQLAARLGADVPFALMGGTAIGTGRGDELSPALAKGRFDWVVVPSDAGLSTPEVYAHLDALRTRPDIISATRAPAVEPGVLQALRAGDPIVLAEHVRNDLQAAALSLRPELRDALELGEQAGALAGMVSGSGPDPGVPGGRLRSPLWSCRSCCRRPGTRRCTCTDRCTARASCRGRSEAT